MPCVVMINFWKEEVKSMQIIKNIFTKSLMHRWFWKETYQELIKKCVVRWPCCMCMLISFIPFWKYTWSTWNILWFCFYVLHFWFFDLYFQLTKPNKSFFQKKQACEMWLVIWCTCIYHYVYPNSMDSRFEHWLKVYHVVGEVVEILEKYQINWMYVNIQV